MSLADFVLNNIFPKVTCNLINCKLLVRCLHYVLSYYDGSRKRKLRKRNDRKENKNFNKLVSDLYIHANTHKS